MEEARGARADGFAIAQAYSQRLDAEFTLAQPIMRQAYSREWWESATPQQIGAVWQATVSWAAVGESYARGTLEWLRQETSARYGVTIPGVELQGRDVIELLARARAWQGLPPALDPDPGAFSFVVRDVSTGVVAAQQLGAVMPPGSSVTEFAANAVMDYTQRLGQVPGRPEGGRFVVEVYPGADVTATPIYRLDRAQAGPVIAQARQRRADVLAGAPASPAELRAALLTERQRLDNVLDEHAAVIDGEPIELIAEYHATETEKAREQREYVELRLAATEADLRGENGVHVFQQAALSRFDDQWWIEATPAEAAVLWGHVAGWGDGWAKLSMTARLQEQIYQRFGVTVADDMSVEQVRSLLEAVAEPATPPSAPEPQVAAEDPWAAPQPQEAASEAEQPSEAPRTVPDTVAVDQEPEPASLPDPSRLDATGLAEALRNVGMERIADTTPPLFDAIRTPPGTGTQYDDIDRAAAAFNDFYGAVDDSLRENYALRWWVTQIEDDLVRRARDAEYPTFDRQDLNHRASLSQLSDEALRTERELVHWNDEHYPVLIELLERRGYDEDAMPLVGSPHGLADARPFEESLDGAQVRINGGAGQIITGIVSRRESQEWWVDGHAQDGTAAQIRLDLDGARPQIEVISQPADEPPAPEADEAAVDQQAQPDEQETDDRRRQGPDQAEPSAPGTGEMVPTEEPPPWDLSEMDADQLADALRRQGADAVADALPPLFAAIQTPPGQTTRYADIDRVVEAFTTVYAAVDEALPRYPVRDDRRTDVGWWLHGVEDDLALRASHAGYPDLDRGGVAARAEWMAMGDAELREAGGRVNEYDDHYDVLVELLERRGYDDFARVEPADAEPQPARTLVQEAAGVFGNPSMLAASGLEDELRRVGVAGVADALEPLFAAIQTPPGEDSDIERARVAFTAMHAAVDEALPGLPAGEGVRWWLCSVQDELVWRARQAGYHGMDADDLATHAEWSALSDGQLRRVRERVNEDDDRFDILVDLLERRGYDEFAEPASGSIFGLPDAQPPEESLAGAHVRVNAGGGRVVTGTLTRHDDGQWWVEGTTQDGAAEQVWLRGRNGEPPYVEVIAPPAGAPPQGEPDGPAVTAEPAPEPRHDDVAADVEAAIQAAVEEEDSLDGGLFSVDEIPQARGPEWGLTEKTEETGRDEQLRDQSRPPLESVPAPGVRPDSRDGQDDVLHRDGGEGGEPDRGSDAGAGRGGPAGRDLPGQGGAAEHGEAEGGGDRAARGGAGRAGAGDRGGPGGDTGGQQPGIGVDADGDRAGAPAVRADSRRAPGVEPAPTAEQATPATAGQDEPQAPAAPPEAPPAEAEPAPRFRPSGQEDLAPSGPVRRVRANIEALRTLRAVQADSRPATEAEQAVLACWSGWGAVPQVFDERETVNGQPGPGVRFAGERAELKELLSEREYAAARRNTLNAHYTDAAIVEAVWDGVARLGFAGGRVLEPGCGSGNFIGLAPEGAQMVGVEVEPVTAGIAAALYPDAQILNESFARTRAPRGSFDLVVGNVPFGDFPMTDRLHNPSDRNIHDAFILKSLALARPGGLVAVISSRYTMDAVNPAVRREMAALGDFVGAVRLPDSAHQRAAGTRVVTDLLVFRPRAADQEPSGPDWEQTRPVQVEGTEVTVNQYWLDHPEQVLGDFALGGAYRGDELTVKRSGGDLQVALSEAIGRVVDQAAEAGLTMSEATSAQTDRGPAVMVAADDRRPEGYLASHPDKSTDFTRVNAFGVAEAYEPPAKQRPELEHLLRIRDTAVELLQAEAASLDDTPEIDAHRARLNTVYDAYVNWYGPLNRFTQRRTGRTDKETGADLFARIRPPQGGFRTDPYAPVVYALENFDSADQRATKAEIFTQRVIAPRTPPLGADTPDEALAICLDAHGEVRLDYIARLLGCPAEDARDRLGTLVFEDPGHPDRLIPATEYLSGQVRNKLTAAREAAVDDPRFDGHVQALTAVIPPDLRPEEINARLGAVWIDAKYVQQFLQEILEDRSLEVHHGGGTYWDVIGDNHGVLATSTWGTDRIPAPKLAKTILEQRTPQVYDNVGTPREPVYVLNVDATAAATEKAEEILERFSEWAWEDPQRTTELARVYNETFNGIVLRSYDGVTLSLPGLAVGFKPHPHQYAAVARMINEPGALLAHEVGAGKTAEQVMGVMELRRLGLVNKPAIVVPNHMLEQFSREFLQLYPQAKLLVAAKEDLRGDRRREFVARCATGDWDAVIIAHSSFEKIPMSREAQEAYLGGELERFEVAIERAGEFGDDSRLVKRLENAKARAEERILRKIETMKDPGITFEATGLDYLVVDELHLFKNLRTPSSIPGAGIDGSNRATDLDMKIHFLRERNGDRVVTGATATPIANSVTEAYVMQRYLRPDLLAEAGLEDFDGWAATFGETRVEIEFSPDGNGFRQKARFAKFVNVPEMLRMWHVSADIKTAEDLDLKVPLLAEREDGKREPETVATEPSDNLLQLVAELGERAEAIRNKRVKPWEDNMLKVSGDGRKAALDLRMMGRDNDPDIPTKLEVAAANITAIWEENRDRPYLGPDGEPHPVPGALQLVFSDLGTPGDKSDGRWNAYDELRDLLVERGLPREAVRFIHEARNDREKGELFAACRSGRVAVLIGSTEKMGVGTNVQSRAVALHHLDCPWRPADLQQREGRIIRQGNQNPEVRILRYVTERSFDGYTWQGVTRKARFIGQVMKGRLDVREMEDIGEQALSYNEVKALASGNPFLMDLAEAEASLTRLERRSRAHRRNQSMLASTIESAEAGITSEESRIVAIDAAIDRRRDTSGEKFMMDLDGVRHTKRPEAGGALKNIIGRQLAVVTKGTHSRQHAVAGEIGGFPVATTVERRLGSYHITVAMQGAPNGEIYLKPSDLQTTKSDALIIRMENRLARFEKAKEEAGGMIDRYHVEIDRAHTALEVPFSETDELTAAQQRVAELKVKLDKLAGTLPEYSAEQATQALKDSLGLRGLVDEAQAVTFVLADGRTGRVAQGTDDRYPYQVRVNDTSGRASIQINAMVSEIPDAVRLLSGDGTIHPSTAATLNARSQPVPAGEKAPEANAGDAQAVAAAALASVSMPGTMSQRLGAGKASATPREQPPRPPEPPRSPESGR